MKERIIKNGIEYELRGEQYYPLLAFDEQTSYEIGKYGRMHLDYLKQHRRGRYTSLLTEGRLNAYLHEIDLQANEILDSTIPRLAAKQGIDENLKAHNALRWVEEMNNIKACVKEMILREVVYQ